MLEHAGNEACCNRYVYITQLPVVLVKLEWFVSVKTEIIDTLKVPGRSERFMFDLIIVNLSYTWLPYCNVISCNP